MNKDYESVIGLEVHAQMNTASKMFCSCSTDSYTADPNTNICPVCTGFPGALPATNGSAYRKGILTALALHCEIPARAKFDRKNYFYPDLPSGFQISEYDEPIAVGGYLDIWVGGEKKRIGITRLHLENDAGKLTHSAAGSLCDWNRAGSPLMEIVSEPDFRSAEEAKAYFSELQKILRLIGTSYADMEKGQLRCDANVSVRKVGAAEFGTRTETKNLNSFRAIENSINYEIKRQIEVVEDGGRIIQQTRNWNDEKKIGKALRDKEEAHDYRYFPEPDLPPMEISEVEVAEMKKSIPELPLERAERFSDEFKIKIEDAIILTDDLARADFFEEAVRVSGDGEKCAKWIINDLLGHLSREALEFSSLKITATQLADLIQLIDRGEISGKIAKEVFEEMFVSGQDANVIIEEKGLKQISDTGALEAIVDKLIADNPEQVASYRAGKENLIGFFMGQVMKATGGQANPGMVNKLLRDKLAA